MTHMILSEVVQTHHFPGGKRPKAKSQRWIEHSEVPALEFRKLDEQHFLVKVARPHES